MQTFTEKFPFLFATRFWAMILGAVALYLQAKGLIGEAEMMLVATITGGFITVNTIDRTVDKATEQNK